MTWLVYAALSAVFASLVGIFGKVGVQGVDSTLATTARALIMALVMSALLVTLGKWRQLADIPRGPLVFIALSGAAGAASWLCYFRALQLGQAAQVAPIDRLSGVLTLILAVTFLGEKVSVPVIAGSALMVLGGVLVARG